MTVSPFDQPQSMLAWNTLGWTSQNMAYPEPLPAIPANLPTGIVMQEITARFLWADGRPKQGNIKVTSSRSSRINGIDIGQLKKRFWLDRNGSVTFSVPTSAYPWRYSIHEAVPGGAKYDIVVPTSPDPVHLSDLRDDIRWFYGEGEPVGLDSAPAGSRYVDQVTGIVYELQPTGWTP